MLIDSLSTLKNELDSICSLKAKEKAVLNFEDRETLEFILWYTYSDDSYHKQDTTKKRIKKPEDQEKEEWWNKPIPRDRIEGEEKRFEYLKKVLRSKKDKLDLNTIHEKFEKLKSHCYRKEWNIYKSIIDRTFFTHAIPSTLIRKNFYGILCELPYIKWMKCCGTTPKFPCYVEPKIPGFRVKVIISKDCVKVYNTSLKDITNKFPHQEYLIGETVEIDGIVRAELTDEKINNLFAYDCNTIGEKLTLNERKSKLIDIASKIPHIVVIPYITIDRIEQAVQFNKNCLLKGYLGAILKKIDSFYQEGYSYNWIDISQSQLKSCRIIEVIGKNTCNAIIAVRNKQEYIVNIPIQKQHFLWEKRNEILGQYCYINEDFSFIKIHK